MTNLLSILGAELFCGCSHQRNSGKSDEFQSGGQV